MLIQAGLVAGRSFLSAGSGGTVGVLWTPWTFGGVWSEFGVMEEPVEGDQHLEGSAGLIVSGGDTNPICPYMRAGVGAYRIETAYEGTHWTMGATVAGGARFGLRSLRAMPMVEARVQIEPGAPGPNQELFCLFAGFWFR